MVTNIKLLRSFVYPISNGSHEIDYKYLVYEEILP